jgi:hypothetical protein
MFNFFNKWKKIEATNIPAPGPKDPVTTRIRSKSLDKEVQQRHSKQLQHLIDIGEHTAQPIHCIKGLKKVKRSFSSNVWKKVAGIK